MKRVLCFVFPCLLISFFSFAQEKIDERLIGAIDQEVLKGMDQGHIPGLSLVILDSGRQIIRTYGYANTETKQPVTPRTLFQLGSCSKAFTALAVAALAGEGKIGLNDYVSDYLPWFRARYQDSLVKMTILQVLHHTAGIPWQTIAGIPESNADNALEETVKGISGVRLHHLPGRKYEYATVDYDILAFIIQKVTGQPFETWMQENILDRLRLNSTTIGRPADSSLLSRGYKIGFFKAREYTAPVFRGNNAAGYIISDANDIAVWLRCQMGLTDPDLGRLADLTHQRDETVPLHGMSSYAMGWDVSLSGNGEISHGGLNPNYTAYIAFRKNRGIGLALMANSNSGLTPVLGNRIMKILAHEKRGIEFDPGDSNDRAYSIGALITGAYILIALAFLARILGEIIKRKRTYRRLSLSKLARLTIPLFVSIPFGYGLYIFPRALAGFTWRSMLVWSPVSCWYLLLLLLCALGISYLNLIVGAFFREKNEFKRVAPRIVLMSILSGLANMTLIILVTSALDSGIRLRYQVFYYILTLFVFLLGRRFVQIHLIRLTRGLIYDCKIDLIRKIFSTSYQKFEKIDRGRIYTSLNGDVEILGGSADQIIMVITNSFTIAGLFVYLASIAFWTAVLTISLIVLIAGVYFLISRNAGAFFEQARDSQNVYMRLVNGMIDGFKEISLHRNKKLEYKADIADAADEYRKKISIASIRFVNAFLLGDSLLILLLGITVFVLPRFFTGIPSYTIMTFVIILLYLIGPVNEMLGAVPGIMQLKVSWKRIQGLLKEIPANLDLLEIPEPVMSNVESIRLDNVVFSYKEETDHESFGVGPLNLEVRTGEILFIIGGNGSGKTTLAKLLTGLYEPDQGNILIDNKIVTGGRLGEHFSTVFNPAFLFEKLYNIKTADRPEEIARYLKILNLDHKVNIEKNRYSTIALSSGQRKRLALLQCYLESSPIYLFDEWAADQDPAYRNFFYSVLLPEIKKTGTIVIAITHDEQYFHVADKILRMKEGKLEAYEQEYGVSPSYI